MPKRTAPYRSWMLEKLRDPEIAAAYVRASSSDPKEFIKALRRVAEANQMSKVAQSAGLQRESIYRTLAETGNPTLESLWGILGGMGMRIAVEPKLTTRMTESARPMQVLIHHHEDSFREIVNACTRAMVGSISPWARMSTYFTSTRVATLMPHMEITGSGWIVPGAVLQSPSASQGSLING